MSRKHSAIRLGALALLGTGVSHAAALPHLQRNGDAIQLVVDGTPYLALAGELHNSSASSPAYMAPIWDQLARGGVRTVIGTASWELLEPQEGRYDFAAIDDEIKQARSRQMRLVMIWFGAYKNAESSYAPAWVRGDEVRFPRGVRDPAAKPGGIAAFFKGPHLSVFGEALAVSDARAFAALMRHIREVDKQRTVIMVQVENEVGMVGSARDHSLMANAAWAQPVPSVLMNYLHVHRDSLKPELADLWGRQGFRETGSWSDVFGTDAAAEEVFMAWAFGSYVGRIAKAGADEYPLPLYANAWLGPQPGATLPGDYPSGGPVARMMDVWKAAAPALAFLAPDIYIEDFNGTLRSFQRSDNPTFVPEARFNAANLFLALGQHAAIGFSPFGIEDGKNDDEVLQAYRLLNEMIPQITAAQAEARIRGFSVRRGAPEMLSLAGYDLSISRANGTLGAFGPGTGAAAQTESNGYGLAISTGPDVFLVIGRGISINFKVAGIDAEIDSAQEGTFRKDQWIAGRTLNGDERFMMFPNDSLRIVRLKLLRR